MALEIHRPRKRTYRMIFNVVLMLCVSAYFLYSYQSSGWTYDIVCGILFLVWGCYILLNLFARRVVFRETADGFEGWNVVRKFRVTWDQLTAMADPDETSHIIFFAYRTSPEGKERYIGMSRRALGDEGADQIIALVKNKRPKIPAFAGGQVQPYAVGEGP